MELLLGAMVIAWIAMNAIHNAKLDHAYAKQGMVSPRLEAKYGSADTARAKVARYGFFDHLRDAWRDGWARRTDALIAARNARAAGGSRFRAAHSTVVATPTSTPTPAAAAAAAGPSQPLAAAPATAAAPAAGPPADPGPANPAPPADHATAGPAANPANPATPAAPAQAAAASSAQDGTPTAPPPQGPTDPAPTNGPADTTGGTTNMSTPTGEVANFETALVELDARIAAHADQIQSADAALIAIAEAKASVEALQTSYEPTAESAANAMDSKDAMHLDGTTMGHAGTAVDSMPVGAVNNLYEQMEQVEQLTQERRDQAQVALEAAQAEREHLIATYADAHDTVASNLGGDSQFLDSSGETAPAPAAADPEPVGASH